MTTNKNLTPKMAAFAESYITDLNATQAAIRAGYSIRTAKSQGQRLLTNVDVASAIAEAMKARSERTMIGADNVLHELARVAFLDIGRAFTPEGTLKPFDKMDDDTRRAIAGFEVSEIRDSDGIVIGFTKKIKLSDKLRALELLGRHLGMFNSKITLKGDGENPLSMLIQAVQGSSFKPVVLNGGKAT